MRSRSRAVLVLGLVGVGVATWFLAPSRELPTAAEVTQATKPPVSDEAPELIARPDIPLVNEPDRLGLAPVPEYPDYRKGWPHSDGKK